MPVSHRFICERCIYKGQLTMEHVVHGCVINDHFFMQGYNLGSFLSLYPRCGTCSAHIVPDDVTGSVYAYEVSQHHVILQRIYHNVAFHEPECTCARCILDSTAAALEDEGWGYEDDPDEDDEM